MTACYVYGIVPADAEPAEVDGHEVETVTWGDVAALVEAVPADGRLSNREALLAHSEVLNAQAAHGPVIPVRFGSIVETVDSVGEDVLRPGHDDFVETLQHLRGHAQFTVRATFRTEEVLRAIVRGDAEIARLHQATAGRPVDEAYGQHVRLGELVSHAFDARRAEVIDSVVTRLQPFSAALRSTPGSGLEQVAGFAFLVADSQLEGFENEAEVLAAELDGQVSLSLMGPLAPFEFVGRD